MAAAATRSGRRSVRAPSPAPAMRSTGSAAVAGAAPTPAAASATACRRPRPAPADCIEGVRPRSLMSLDLAAFIRLLEAYRNTRYLFSADGVEHDVRIDRSNPAAEA